MAVSGGFDVPVGATAEDVLVFRRADGVFHLVGGAGRGAGWASIVDIAPAESPLMENAWRSGVPVRVSAPDPVRVGGPYWAAQAAVVPVGREHLVVLGGAAVGAMPDAVLVADAARAVAHTGDASAEKLLTDELEVVHAVRALQSYQPLCVRDTARHIATVAAKSLSCDVAAVSVRGAPEPLLEVLQLADGEVVGTDPGLAGRDAARFLDAAATVTEPIVEQSVGAVPEVWTDPVVSRMTLPIGGGLGTLALGHAVGRERGFTSLCQRIARALAESAEALLSQAIAHEQLAAEREQYQRATQIDPLTGIGNRAAWVAALESVPTGTTRYAVLSADVDGLKMVNDAYGHATGDNLLRLAAGELRSTLRESDVVCRVGGDEFLALLADAGESEAEAVAKRIAAALSAARLNDEGLTASLSIGWAAFDGDWDSTTETADERMYASRREHGSRRTPPMPKRHGSRRRRRTDSHGWFGR
jgi:diguanylate cyclase (GGDEF)-like protein